MNLSVRDQRLKLNESIMTSDKRYYVALSRDGIFTYFLCKNILNQQVFLGCLL